MKHEWRKTEKSVYIPKQTPTITSIKSYHYIVIEGVGNPNSLLFATHVEALYALSYGIRMAPKQGIVIPGYFEYTVYPLEGVWDLTDEGKELMNNGHSVVELKDYLKYKLMIRQPEFVTKSLFEDRQQAVYKKKQNDAILEARFELIEEGLCCQMLHVGPYDDEPETFRIMEQYVEQQGYHRLHKQHREIYLSDPRKTEPQKMKTTLRFRVEKREHRG